MTGTAKSVMTGAALLLKSFERIVDSEMPAAAADAGGIAFASLATRDGLAERARLLAREFVVLLLLLV